MHPFGQVLWGDIWKRTLEKSQTNATNALVAMWLCLFWGRQFEDTFENTQWRQTKQMQLMWLYMLWSKCFQEPYEKTQRDVWLVTLTLSTLIKNTLTKIHLQKIHPYKFSWIGHSKKIIVLSSITNFTPAQQIFSLNWTILRKMICCRFFTNFDVVEICLQLISSGRNNQEVQPPML